ncbi:uncharacterized protein PV09_03504 [Verruconis gallopava]|uniref:Uncharacterized protein n=1 Tax=Verruconis gallopava TaxID=253628 RepID=A0A0D2AF91_9PEZI|nr:uncharacterized protein PV09_03504 [Verruconis gallopava]KIW05633.1 hypothetical protein PV09_03504 [Verruconis gallopava]
MTNEMGDANAKPGSWKDKQGQCGQNVQAGPGVIGGQVSGQDPLLIAPSALDLDGLVQEAQEQAKHEQRRFGIRG